MKFLFVGLMKGEGRGAWVLAFHQEFRTIKNNPCALPEAFSYIKIESSLTKDYKVLFTNIKGREQSNIWCCCTVQGKNLCNFSQKQEVAN